MPLLHARHRPEASRTNHWPTAKKAEKSVFPIREKVGSSQERERDYLKMNEQNGNVIENKAFHFLEDSRSGNVIDNKTVTL